MLLHVVRFCKFIHSLKSVELHILNIKDFGTQELININKYNSTEEGVRVLTALWSRLLETVAKEIAHYQHFMLHKLL